MISAKNLVVRKPQTLHQRLAGLLDSLVGCDRNQLAQILITASITQGVTSGPAIIAEVEALGFNEQHIRIQLSKGLERPAGLGSWRKDADRQYHLNE